MSDGLALKDEAARVKFLGTIVVEAWHTQKGRRVTSVRKKSSTRSAIGIVSEKVIKGETISHGVG